MIKIPIQTDFFYDLIIPLLRDLRITFTFSYLYDEDCGLDLSGMIISEEDARKLFDYLTKINWDEYYKKEFKESILYHYDLIDLCFKIKKYLNEK